MKNTDASVAFTARRLTGRLRGTEDRKADLIGSRAARGHHGMSHVVGSSSHTIHFAGKLMLDERF